MKRWRLVLLCSFIHFLALNVIGEANFFLGELGLALHLEALLVLFAGLYFRLIHGVGLAILIGLLADAGEASPWGSYFLILLLLWALVFSVRNRLQSENFAQITVFALALQTIYLAATSLFYAGSFFDQWIYWQRILSEGLLSLFVVFLAAYPWTEFNRLVLREFGWDLNAELRQA